MLCKPPPIWASISLLIVSYYFLSSARWSSRTTSLERYDFKRNIKPLEKCKNTYLFITTTIYNSSVSPFVFLIFYIIVNKSVSLLVCCQCGFNMDTKSRITHLYVKWLPFRFKFVLTFLISNYIVIWFEVEFWTTSWYTSFIISMVFMFCNVK